MKPFKVKHKITGEVLTVVHITNDEERDFLCSTSDYEFKYFKSSDVVYLPLCEPEDYIKNVDTERYRIDG